MCVIPPDPPCPATAAAPEDPAFDRWLQAGLHLLFGDVLEEPLPEPLLALLSQHAPEPE